jgi:diguanylate cyclase (GGDEF)-like protein
MLKRFDGLSLRAKIIAGIMALIVLGLAADFVSVMSHRQALAAVNTFLDRDNRIAELALTSRATLLRARRNEKDFLLKVNEFGYEEARSRYVTLLRRELADVRWSMAAVRALSGDAEMAAQAQAIEGASSTYEAAFLRVVELYGRLGRRDMGLEGAFRQRAHAIEALLQDGAPERLTSGLLALRRAEKDFLLRSMSMYAQAFDRHADQFRARLRQAALPAQRTQQLLRLTDEYQALFREYVTVEDAIESASQDYLVSVHTVEPMLDRLHARAGEAATTTRATLDRLGRVTEWTVGGAGVVALLLGLMVALFISRSVARALRECMAFAGSLSAGNLAARLRSADRTEFGVLAGSLNRMADALQAAHARQQEQSTELQRLNRALRVLSQCNETLVRATSEDELVGSICRHVVEIGGYRLAWVGYACHDQARSIEPAAHAGTDRDYVDQLHLSWGDDERRRGVGGTAVRERRVVLARQLSTDPVFEAWRAAALQRRLASCIALPLQAKGDVLGMLCIYAEEDDAFDSEEIKVLQELTDDLAYGIASLREAEQRSRFERELEHQANFDALTGLANRFTLEARLTQSVADAKRHGNKLALMSIDLDRFKLVNDTLGHGVGDQLLTEVARLLSAAVRESDTVARLGGDEFVVLLKDIEAMADAATVAGKLIAALNTPICIDGHEIRPSASIGISLFPDDGEDVSTLMRNADTAMHHAKALGGGSFRFFAPQMNERVAARFAMEADLRRALEHGELLVYYQPQVSLSSGVMTGAEALVRWRHPSKGMVSPAEFIPLAEETGLIEPLGEWVIGSVCRQLRAWLDAGVPVQPVAVNLSARQFRQSELVPLIAQSLADNGLDPALLTLEITEGAVMHDVEAAVVTVRQLKALGVRLSLDDFGTGYSSLSYLKRFPIDHLKIDQSFVREITTDPDSAVICNAVIGLAHSLRMTVIAEGVETEAQMQYLRRQRCDEMQGYLFSKPVPAQEFAGLLGEDRRLTLPVTEQAQRTVLIVDDEANVLSALRRLLRRDGYRIITAGSAREGLELLATHSVQVVLSDQRMPGMNGTEFLSRVKELHPQTIRIILSGYTELESVIDAINRGAIYRFFTKPWNDDALRGDIHAAFHHHALIHGRELAPIAEAVA